MGNTPITIAGITIGMMITSVPWFTPTCFEGQGINLPFHEEDKNDKNAIKFVSQARPQKLPQRQNGRFMPGSGLQMNGQKQPTGNRHIPSNPKKMSREQFERSSFEEEEEEQVDQASVRSFIESKLDFVKQAGKPGCSFKLLSTTKTNNLYSTTVELQKQRNISQQLPLNIKLSVSHNIKAK